MRPADGRDDARFDVVGWNLPAQRISSAGCRVIPIQAKLRIASGWTGWGSQNIMRGSTLEDVGWFQDDGKDSFQFCPAYGDAFGAYTVGPSMVNAYDPGSGASLETQDGTRGTLYIRRNATATISTTRSGNYVTVKATAKRFVVQNSTGKYVAWPNAVAYVQVKSGTGWVTKKAVRTSSTGLVSYRFYAPKAQTWRISVATITDTRGGATASSTR